MLQFVVIAASIAVVAKAAAAVTLARTEMSRHKQTDDEALGLEYQQKVGERFKSALLRLDAGYQAFMSQRIDPLLIGNARDKHLKELIDTTERPLSEQEKKSNRRLGLSFIALTLLGDAYLFGAPVLSIVVIAGIYNLFPWFKQGYHIAVKERRFGIIHLIGLYFSLMWLGGYFFIGTLASIFTGFCQKIQVITQIGARNALVDVLGQKPQQVWIEVNEVEVEIPFEQLKLGDILILDAGQMIPVDGVIVDGWALVDQQRLTGESQPIEKSVGDGVLAATVIIGGKLRVQVEKSGNDTAAAKIGEVLNHTVEYEVDNLGAEFASVENTLLPMLLGGLTGWLLAGPVAGIAVLGCNYVVGIVPLRMITLLNALSTGSEHGILVKDGRALEGLKDIDTLVFDKTGTLTLDQPHIIAFHVCENHNEEELLTLAATAEHRQTHPIAQAILAAAKDRNLELPVIDAAHYEIGYGLKVDIDDKKVFVGSQRFMEMENIAIPENIVSQAQRCSAEGRSLVYVGVNQQLVGAIELDATLRPEAKEIVTWLKQQDIKLYIISGDQESPTQRLAEHLGMDGYFANTLPDEKANLVEDLQKQGRKVCFIGDGINDAIALQAADVSISFRGATNVASDSAHIVLMDDNLEQLKALFALTRAYDKNLSSNYQQAVNKSFIAALAVLVFPFKFLIVEGFWVVTFATGITTATRPLLTQQENETLGKNKEEEISKKGVDTLIRDA